MPRLLFALFLPLMLLAACGQVPQPFAKAPTGGGYVAPEAPPPPEDSVLVRVHPVTGTAVPMGRLLAQAVSDALNGRNLTATTQPGSEARFELRGHARINDDDPRLPYVALIDWTLTDRGGGPAGLVTQGVEGSRWHWDYGDPRMIRSVARGAAGPVGDLVARDMPPDSSPPPLIPRRAAEPVVAKGPPLVRVAPVTGAPGDGNGALTRAIRTALAGQGLRLALDEADVDYVVRGAVRLDPPVKGQQDVEILWTVESPDGRPLGSAAQHNQVPTGSLNGRWGPLAGEIATAASGGLKGILEQVRAGGG